MVAVLLGCVVWLWAVPQSPPDPDPVANPESVAREVSKEQDWTVALPEGLSKEWVPVNIRLIRAENKPETWHAGYQAPNNEFVSANQTKSGDESWVGDQTQDGERSGSSTVAGASWARYADGDVRSLRRSTPLGGLDTVVSGKVGWAELERFAAALEPVEG